MAEVSEIEAGGEVRTVKDATARAGVAANAAAIEEIETVIPSSASASNLLATQADIKNYESQLINFIQQPGLTMQWADNRDAAHTAYRIGNILFIQATLVYSGTYTGPSGWREIIQEPSSLIHEGETVAYPYMLDVIMNYAGGYREVLLGGRNVGLQNGTTYNCTTYISLALPIIS